MFVQVNNEFMVNSEQVKCIHVWKKTIRINFVGGTFIEVTYDSAEEAVRELNKISEELNKKENEQ